VAGEKHDGRFMAAGDQGLLEFQPAHSRHCHVQQQAAARRWRMTLARTFVLGNDILKDFAYSSDRADVNQMAFQYFINYNLSKGWYLTW